MGKSTSGHCHMDRSIKCDGTRSENCAKSTGFWKKQPVQQDNKQKNPHLWYVRTTTTQTKTVQLSRYNGTLLSRFFFVVIACIISMITHYEAGFHFLSVVCSLFPKAIITKTRLFKNIENFSSKNWKFSHNNSDIIFHISAQKHRLWVLVRTASARRF